VQGLPVGAGSRLMDQGEDAGARETCGCVCV